MEERVADRLSDGRKLRQHSISSFGLSKTMPEFSAATATATNDYSRSLPRDASFGILPQKKQQKSVFERDVSNASFAKEMEQDRKTVPPQKREEDDLMIKKRAMRASIAEGLPQKTPNHRPTDEPPHFFQAMETTPVIASSQKEEASDMLAHSENINDDDEEVRPGAVAVLPSNDSFQGARNSYHDSTRVFATSEAPQFLFEAELVDDKQLVVASDAIPLEGSGVVVDYERLRRKHRMFSRIVCVVASGLLVAGAVVGGVLGTRQTPSSPPPASPLSGVIMALIASRSPNTDFTNPTETRALDWILQDEYTILSTLSEETVLQRFGLAALYFSTNGNTSWADQMNWLSPINECVGWGGIFCDSTNNSVLSISLDANGLSGSLPIHLGLLTELTSVFMSGNQMLGGVIPSELGLLTRLVNLHFETDTLSGEIPTELGRLEQLTDLALNQNNLGGNIPTQLGNLRLLRFLTLFENRLEGDIPTELGLMTRLEACSVYSNGLDGTLPSEIGQWTRMQQFYVDDNLLQGTIPSEMGQLTQMLDWRSQHNVLGGTIPTELGGLSKIYLLDLNQNDLQGTIPSEMGKLLQLTLLYAGDNDLAGTLPDELWKLTLMTWFDLGGNNLEGALSTKLGRFTHLQELWLSSNLFRGNLPSETGNLSLLDVLFLDTNNLSGTIPSELGQLTLLNALTLYNNNRLMGTIPSALCGANQLLIDCAQFECACCQDSVQTPC